MSPPEAKTSCRQLSPDSHATNRASMALKSLTAKRCPSLGISAVRISCESVSLTLP